MPKKNIVHSAVRVLLKKTAQSSGMSLLVVAGKQFGISVTVAQRLAMSGTTLIL